MTLPAGLTLRGLAVAIVRAARLTYEDPDEVVGELVEMLEEMKAKAEKAVASDPVGSFTHLNLRVLSALHAHLVKYRGATDSEMDK